MSVSPLSAVVCFLETSTKLNPSQGLDSNSVIIDRQKFADGSIPGALARLQMMERREILYVDV